MPQYLPLALGLALLMAVAATLYPALQATRVRVADSFRALLCDTCGTVFDAKSGQGMKGPCIAYPKRPVDYQIQTSDIVMKADNLITAYLDTLKRQVHGSGMQHITKGKFNDSPVPLPPPLEQEHIVERIESLFTQLDTGVAGLKHLKEVLTHYKTSVLKAACEGRLVPQDPSDEPAKVFLDRILATRKKTVPSPDVSDLKELPKGWVWATAEQLSDPHRSITYGVVKLGKEFEGGVQTLRTSNVRHLFIDPRVVKKISPKIANQYKRTTLQGGEILIAVRGTLGGVALVPNELAGFNISREVAMIALSENSTAPFVQYFIGSKPLQNWLNKRIRGIAYVGINIETLKKLPIPIPPLREQRRIVAEIERRLSVVQELE